MPPPASGIDLDRYPMHPLDSDSGQRLVAHCRAQLAIDGACELPGFLTPDATQTMARGAAAVANRAHHHSGASTPYLELPPTDLPENHPRKTAHPFALGAVAWDHIAESHLLRQLAGDESRVKRIPMEPGTLLLFHGRHSIHCVTSVEGTTTRLVALLAYDTKPGARATPFLRQARYGRVLRPA